MRMQLAQEIMCDGNVEFVYALDPATGVISMGATDSLQVLDKSTYKFHAVLQGTLLHHDAMLDLAEVVGFGDSWMPGDDAAESLELTMCEDLDEYLQYLSISWRDAFFEKSVKLCGKAGREKSGEREGGRSGRGRGG